MTRASRVCALALSFALAGPSPKAAAAEGDLQALTQQVGELTAVVRELQARLAAQEAMIHDLEARLGEAASSAPAPAPAPAATPAVGASSNYFNPAISLIGNFLSVSGHTARERARAADLRESELSLQAVVDPYARADVFLSFGEEGVEVEEGFLTFTQLPADLLLKVGRMRASFGKVNTLHLHSLPWPDTPLSGVNLLGGEEGFIGTGVSISKLLPIGDLFTEATLQVFDGEAEGLFEAPRRSDLAFNGHYRIFADLTEASNLDLGISVGLGHNGATASSTTTLEGLDLTYRYKPLRTALYRSFTLRGELITAQREDGPTTEHPLGWFVSGELQVAKRWALGARLEAADHLDDESRHDRGAALLVTFSPTEFSSLRGEYRHRLFADDTSADELLFQLQFAIGAHGAHPF